MVKQISCHLYKQDPVKRFWDTLLARGISKDAITVDNISSYDQLHYCGHEATERALKTLSLPKNSKILDIGSGYGGTARYLAKNYGIKVDTLEYQEDFVHLACELNKITKTADFIIPSTGDILEFPTEHKYDGIVAFLVFLHVADKPALWKKCYQLLKPNAKFCIEDYFVKSSLSVEEKDLLQNTVGVCNLQTKEETLQTVKDAGFTNIGWEELTTSWASWTYKRAQDYLENISQHEMNIGILSAQNMLEFYQGVADLFAKGNVGGVRISGIR